jgi:hypothetical protein
MKIIEPETLGLHDMGTISNNLETNAVVVKNNV